VTPASATTIARLVKVLGMLGGSADTSVLYRRDEIDEEIALGGGSGDMDDAIPF
jgi:hypothetical protein